MTDLPGEQFWAKVTSKRQEERDAESLLRKALEGFPENCLKAEAVGEPRQDHNETVTRLGITVRVAVDPQAYQTFSREVRRVLNQIAKNRREQETATRFERQPGSEPPVFCWQPNQEVTIRRSKSSSLSSSPLSEKFVLALLGTDHPAAQPAKSSAKSGTKRRSSTPPSKKSSSFPKRSVPSNYSLDTEIGENIVFALNTQLINSGTDLKWKCYLLDKRLRPLLREAASRTLCCRVLLVDAAGAEVAAQEIAPGAKRKESSSTAKNSGEIDSFPMTLFRTYHETKGRTRELKAVLASQVFFGTVKHTEQLPELRYDCVFDLTDAKLRSVTQTRCKLSTIKPNSDTPEPNRTRRRSE
jgi:hypothetical protein